MRIRKLTEIGEPDDEPARRVERIGDVWKAENANDAVHVDVDTSYGTLPRLRIDLVQLPVARASPNVPAESGQ